MGHGAESKCKFVQRLRIPDEVVDEISAAQVMNQVAEELFTLGVIADVLDDAAGICVAMSFHQVRRGSLWKSLQQHRLDALIPSGINNRFMREDGIGKQRLAT